jgi:sec-independent protein translocase protein TatC
MKQKAEKKPPDEMTIFEHLDELRQRLIKIIIALVVGAILGMFVAEQVLKLLISPLGDQVPQTLSLTEAPSVFFRIAILIGVIIAMPVIVYQLFQYARPGLMPSERRYVLIGAPAASLSFAAGVAFAALVLLRPAISFLQRFLEDIVQHNYSIERYISFVSTILLWAGLIFETPLIMYFLARLGVVSPEGFAKARRLVIVAGAVGAAIITPTVDPINMLLIMVPFIVLYELGILLARLGRPR